MGRPFFPWSYLMETLSVDSMLQGVMDNSGAHGGALGWEQGGATTTAPPALISLSLIEFPSLLMSPTTHSGVESSK